MVLQAVLSTAKAAADNTATSFLISCSLSSESTHVDEMSGDRGRGSHRRTDEMGAPAGTLPALEVAIRGRSTALARSQSILVHSEAHRASRLAPFEASGGEDAVETLALGLLLDLPGTGND